MLRRQIETVLSLEHLILFPELSIETSKSFWNLKLIIINDTVNIEGRGRKKNTQNLYEGQDRNVHLSFFKDVTFFLEKM